MGILQIFLTLQLAYGSFSTAMVKFENDRDGYISAVEGITLFLSGIFIVIYIPFHSVFNKIFELPTWLMIIMIVEITVTNAFTMWTGKKRFEYKYKSVVAVTLLVSFIAPIVAYFLVINTSNKGYARIIGYSAINIIVGTILFVQQGIKGKNLFSKKYWRYAFSFNIPLLAYYLSQTIFNQSDRIMISHMIGTDKAAVYGVAYNLAMVLTFVLNAINGAYVPWYYEKIKNNDLKANRQVSLAIALIIAILVSAVIWFAPEIIFIMAGEKYADAVYIVPPVAISLLLLFFSQLSINVEFYFEEKGGLVYASIGAALFNIIANYIFIKMYGYIAAGYTTLVSYLIFAYANYRVARRVMNEKALTNDGVDIKAMVTLFGIFSLTSLVAAILYPHMIVRIGVVILLFSFVFYKRNHFIDLFKRLKSV